MPSLSSCVYSSVSSVAPTSWSRSRLSTTRSVADSRPVPASGGTPDLLWRHHLVELIREGVVPLELVEIGHADSSAPGRTQGAHARSIRRGTHSSAQPGTFGSTTCCHGPLRSAAAADPLLTRTRSARQRYDRCKACPKVVIGVCPGLS
jgi:hypothetical protein